MMPPVIVLCGGAGTRLSSVSQGRPKILVDFLGKPFLDVLLANLHRQGITQIVLATGYLSAQVEDWVHGSEWKKKLDIFISCESTPLGTGGAIKNAFKKVRGKQAVVLNGDTFIDLDFFDFVQSCHVKEAELAVVCCWMNDADRYGVVSLSGDKVGQFVEKGRVTSGYVNAGAYLISKRLVDQFVQCPSSFEHDFLMKPPVDIFAYVNSGGFLDYGTPDGHRQATCMLVDSHPLMRGFLS